MARRQWADYFDQQGVQYAFFSAANAAALQQARREALAEPLDDSPSDSTPTEELADNVNESSGPKPSHEVEGHELGEGNHIPESDDSSSEASLHDGHPLISDEDSPDVNDPRARVLSVLELEQLFINAAPHLSG